MLKQVLTLVNSMLLFAAVSILILGSINSMFGAELGLKIGGYRIALPADFFAIVGISVVLVCFSGLLSVALNFKTIAAWVKASPLKVGGGLVLGFMVLGTIGYFVVMHLAGGPLTFAVERGDHAAVKEILASTTYGQQALDAQLYQSIANGDYEIAETLIEHGADVDCKFGEFESPLLIAAVLWHEAKATEFLLQHGADPNRVDKLGRSPLLQTVIYRASPYSTASSADAPAIVMDLIDAGASPTLAASNGDSPLTVAEREKNKEPYSEIAEILRPKVQ